MITSLFSFLLGRSVGAAVVIGVVLLCRFLLRDAPKTFRMVLWGVVAARLLCPYAPESPLSLAPDAPAVVSTFAQTDAFPVGEFVTIFAPDAAPYPVPVRETTPPDASHAPTLLQILSGVWFAGLCALLAWSLCGYLKLRRTVSASLPLSDGVSVCDDIASPFVLGVIRPRVYVPSGLSDAELSCVLAHERAHIRRGDAVWKLCAWLTTCLYWFHPLVWASYALFCRDMELACDEAAIRGMDASRRTAYSETLLNCGLRRRRLQVCPPAFGETGVKERVRAVLRYRKPAFWATCAAAVVCVAAAVCLLTRPVSADTIETELPDGAISVGPDGISPTLDGSEINAGLLSVGEGEAWQWVCNDADANWPKLKETLQYVEFPGVTFYWTPNSVTAKDADGVETVLYDGMPVWSVYLADLNGDGFSEFCSMVSMGSGLIDERIIVYDYKAGRVSELQDRGFFNYTLSLENGTLTARQWNSKAYSSPLVTGTLRLTDAGKLLLAPSKPETIGAARREEQALSDELNDAVRKAIIERDKLRYVSGEFDAESHVLLAMRSDPVREAEVNSEAAPTVTLYLMSLHESFDYANGRFERVSGRSGPVALTFRMEDGGPVLTEYWEPRDGAYYWPDVREKFPSSLTDAQLDTQTYVLRENQDLYAQVVGHWNIDTAPILDALFEEIMSEPSPSSNPGDYLNAHPLALRKLLYYGSYTQAYVDANIGTATGLRQALMKLVSQRLGESVADLSEIGELTHATLTHMRDHAGPEPGTYALSEPEKLSKLAGLLKQTEEIMPTGCPFEDVLTLTDKNGECVQLMMAADSCAVYRYNGQYYRYGADNGAFYELFAP